MSHRFNCLFIGGRWVSPHTDKTIALENPATREVFAHVPEGTVEDAVDAITAASKAKKAWAAVPLTERVELMCKTLAIVKQSRSL